MTVDRWGSPLAIGIALLSVGLGVTALLLKGELVEADLAGIPFFAFGVVGAFVAARQPRNAIGWVFMVVGTMPVIGFFSSNYALHVITSGAGWPLVGLTSWISSWAWIPGVATLLTFCLQLYPDGRLPSRRWRFLPYASGAALLGAVAGIALMPGKMEPFEEGGPRVENPLGIQGAGSFLETVGGFCLGALLFLGLLSAVSLVYRFRTTSPEQRQQIKWFMYPAAMLVIVVLLERPIQTLFGETIEQIFFSGAILALPVGTAIGILKYRLFDVDVVINRTLVYLSLTAILVGTYLGIVVLLQQVLSGVTSESDLAVAASTLAVAALFRPLRARVQAFIDQRFYRRKYDAAATLERFSSRLRDQVDLDSLSAQVLDVVSQTIQPAHASLWLRTRSEP